MNDAGAKFRSRQMSKGPKVLVSVVIPTVDRKIGLSRAVTSVTQQKIDFASIEIVVVDNSPDQRQSVVLAPIVKLISPPFELTYVYEPRAGLAFARNSGIAEAKGDYVVFLDDDEKPLNEFWLENLITVAIDSKADVTFGSVIPEFEIPPTKLRGLMTVMYSRNLIRPDGADVTNLFAYLGTGNSCFRHRTGAIAPSIRFNPDFNSIGGEDTELLRRLRFDGRKFSWAPRAKVLEYIPDSRMKPDYLARRRFRHAQTRSYVQIVSPPRRYDLLFFWMTVGALQATYHFVAKRFSLAFGSNEEVDRHNIMMWGGLGKLFWQAKYRRAQYGS